VAFVSTDSTRWLSLLAFPLEVGGAPTGERLAWRIDADPSWLPPEQSVVWADLVLDDERRPVAALVTSEARLHAFSTDSDVREVTAVDPARAAQTRLLEIEGAVYLFYPRLKCGVACEVISRPRRRM